MHKVENSSLKNLLVHIQLNIKIKNNYLCNDFIVIYFLYKILSLNLIFIFSYYFDIKKLHIIIIFHVKFFF